MEPLNVGICGLGTVAQGVLKVLLGNRERITRHAGREIRVVAVASRRAKPEVDLGDAVFSTDVRQLAASDDIDVLVELIGGEDTALELVETSLANGTSVVTGNKAIIALHGNELLPLAAAHQAHLGFEAAVAGSIPIIANLTHSLVADEHQWLAGIINGTSNFILTAMCERGESFADALAEAQRLGYAEADPSFDVEGIDAAGPGFGLGGTDVTFPINRQQILLGQFETEASIGELDHRGVAIMNSRTGCYAERFLFSPAQDFPVFRSDGTVCGVEDLLRHVREEKHSINEKTKGD